MKKFLTALIAFVMCFSVVTTAFAATPDETSDSDLISDIKQAMLDTYYGDEKPEYLNVEILLDDEDGVYFSFSDSFATSANRVYTEAGNYIVSYLENCPVALYKNNRVYMIPDAYNSGVIDDDTLEGLTYCGHMDIVPKSDDSALVIEIKNKVIEECFDGKSPETLRIDIVGRTSDGGVCYRHEYGFALGVIIEEKFGDCTYSYTHGNDVMLYKNNSVYSIKNAYESGIIDDKIVNELVKMNIGIIPDKDVSTLKQLTLKMCQNAGYTDLAEDDIDIWRIIYLSDDRIMFTFNVSGADIPESPVKEVIGNYTFIGERQLYIYADGQIYTLKEAFDAGIIDNDDLAFFADDWKDDISFSIVLNPTQPGTTAPTEPTTSTATPDEPATSPAATSATKPVSTSDTATNDTLSNSQNNSGAVQTGQNSVAVILLVAMLAGCAVIFAKRRNYFK
jgi:hypothetical protein